MTILEMTATFGRLNGAVLRPGEGLNLIEGDNEAGKSTWCAFLRAMFYGFPSRDRDRAGHLAEKNRYQPWSGAAMAGSITLRYQGRVMTLRRGPQGTTPWGAFSARWTDTQDPVAGLTGENCGQVLLGVSREVFERTAFFGQGAGALGPSADLEKRIAALAAGGEEEVSYTQAERRLKDRMNRRRVNSKVGRIPELEEELARVEALLARQGELLEAQRLRQELTAQRDELSAQLQLQADTVFSEQTSRYGRARQEYELALARYHKAAEAAKDLPSTEVLRSAQGDLGYLRALERELKRTERDLPELQAQAEHLAHEVQADPCFAGQEPAQAAEEAQADCEAAERLLKPRHSLWPLVGLVLGAVAGWYASPQLLVLLQEGGSLNWKLHAAWAGVGGLIGLLLLLLPTSLRSSSRRRKGEDMLDRYRVSMPSGILDRSKSYAELWEQAKEAEQAWVTLRNDRAEKLQQRQELTGQLLELVHGFAPTAGDIFGITASISRALQQGENLHLAETELAGAEKLLQSLPAPQPVEGMVSAGAGGLSEQLHAVDARLTETRETIARLTEAVGDPAELEGKRNLLLEELDRRREEYAALELALKELQEADGQLRERFSPQVNQRAGAYLSALTGGKYTAAALTRQFQALAMTDEQQEPRQDIVLSGGTAQQLYLAVRLALCDLLLDEGESCPIVLDDAMDPFDDERARLALRCLESVAQERQVFLFTCHSRERDLLAGRDVTFLRLR